MPRFEGLKTEIKVLRSAHKAKKDRREKLSLEDLESRIEKIEQLLEDYVLPVLD